MGAGRSGAAATQGTSAHEIAQRTLVCGAAAWGRPSPIPRHRPQGAPEPRGLVLVELERAENWADFHDLAFRALSKSKQQGGS